MPFLRGIFALIFVLAGIFPMFCDPGAPAGTNFTEPWLAFETSHVEHMKFKSLSPFH